MTKITDEKLEPRVAVYAGTFDPVTNGHLDILARALAVFDILYLAIASGGPRVSTKSTFFSAEERMDIAERALKEVGQTNPNFSRVKVASFDSLLINFTREVNSKVIIRGLRAVSDYEYETQLAHTNRMLAPEIETIFFVTSEPNSYISSSIVKNVALNGGDISKMVTKSVVKDFSKKLASL